MRRSVIDYTTHMYSIQENTSVRRRKASQEGAPPARTAAGGGIPGASLPGRPLEGTEQEAVRAARGACAHSGRGLSGADCARVLPSYRRKHAL